MSRTLTKKQKGFVQDYLETGNGSLAVKQNYDITSDESARAIASQNLTKPKVIEYLQSKAERAAEIVFELAETGEMDSVKLSAAKDILDRAGHKAIDKTLNLTAIIDITPTEELKELADGLLRQQKDS